MNARPMSGLGIRALLSRGHRWRAYGLAGLVATGVFFAIALPTWQARDTLGEPSMVSGYALITLLFVQSVFNIRKRLAVLPLLRTHWWTVAHVVGGTLAIALFWLHTDSLWPGAGYERWLAALFYLVSLTGIIGLVLQQFVPPRLTRTGHEVIFERIPNEISRLKREAEAVVLACTQETGHDTLARFYVESLQWFFFQPRFRLGHIAGTQMTEFWLDQRFATVRRYLNGVETRHLSALEDLARRKTAVDAQYVGQSLLHGWLSIHLPLAIALITLTLWHLLLAHVYAL